MIPKAGKVNMKSPQYEGRDSLGITKIPGVDPKASGNPIKGGLKVNPKPGAAPRPSTSGTKIKKVIQSGTSASNRKA